MQLLQLNMHAKSMIQGSQEKPTFMKTAGWGELGLIGRFIVHQLVKMKHRKVTLQDTLLGAASGGTAYTLKTFFNVF